VAPAETPAAQQIDKAHYLDLRSGRFDKTNREDLRPLFDTFALSPYKDRLVVHFHGGLVSESAGLGTAQRLLPVYEAAQAYPVFFVWQSQWYETIRNNVADIFREDIFQKLLKKVLQFAVGKIDQQTGGRGLQLELAPEGEVDAQLAKLKAGEDPFDSRDPHILGPDARLEANEEQQFRRALESDGRLRELVGAISQSDAVMERSAGATRVSTKTLMDPSVVNEIRSDTTSSARALPVGTLRIVQGAVQVLIKVISRFSKHRDHGIYDTVFEEVLREFYIGNAGQLIWSEMKQDTARAFQPDPAAYGGTAFLAELGERWRSGLRPKITLVGHSTGAIYICHLLENSAALPPDIQFGVVLLAPAANFKLLNSTLQNSSNRIMGIRVFGMKDDLEFHDGLIRQLPGVYPSSLLYFVSGVLENEADVPIVGMQRFYSGRVPYVGADFADIQSSMDYFARSSRPAFVWAECRGDPGFNCLAHDHADFTHDPATMGSVKQIIRADF
jgi:hypothetical protein